MNLFHTESVEQPRELLTKDKEEKDNLPCPKAFCITRDEPVRSRLPAAPLGVLTLPTISNY